MKQFRDRQRSLAQMTTHLHIWVEELTAWELVLRQPIAGWTHAGPDDAAPQAIALGQSWPDRHGIHRFTSPLLSPPAPMPGALRALRLDFGGEAMVTLRDAAGAQLDRFGANPHHRAFRPLPSVPFVIEAEVAARSLFGIPNRDPRLTEAAFVDHDPDIRGLRRRLDIIARTAASIGQPDLARDLLDAASAAIALLRLPTATAEVGPRMADQPWARAIWERSFDPTDAPAALSPAAHASVTAALTALDASLSDLRAAYPKKGKVMLIGHAHIDYVWLWPQPETLRKITRTFNGVTSLMRAYPDFTFNQSSSLYYDHIAETDPACLAEIQAAVARGQWEPIGGMYVECDTNMPSAEAFCRQFLYGQRRFVDLFGAPCRTAWLPDTFGFTGSMPQIMKSAGIDTLVTIKVSWSETNRMPENLFHWQGNDGTRVLVHTFDAYKNDGYNMLMRPEALVEVWGNHAGRDLSDTVIASYGWGDGGGGPAPEQIEAIPLLNLMPGLPALHHGRIQDHIDALTPKLEGAAVPVWQGEMYLEYHRATLTTQGAVKQMNRRAEYALVAAEAATELARMGGTATPRPDLSADWRLMLRNQFHDILPGSSIREAYEQTIPELRGVTARSEAAAARALGDLSARLSTPGAKGLAIANLSGSAKDHWQIHSATPLPEALMPQAIGGGYVTTGDMVLPPLSVTFAATSNPGALHASATTLENDLVRVTIDAQGRISSHYDKRCLRELVDGAANRIMIYPNDLPRNYDAWDIEPGFAASGYELTEATIALTATGPHMAEITVTRRVSASTITTRYRLWANSARLDMVTDIDWHDRRTYVRAAFPLQVLAESATYDQAIGVTHRATHDNTTWQQAQFEGCGHRFVALSECDWGGALLSADKYGMAAKGNTLTLSLIRGPMYPDMLADEGHHQFTYSLLPHNGQWSCPEVQAEADLINDPLRHVPATSGAGFAHQPVAWTGLQARLHALKPSEDGVGSVLRLSETAGRRGGYALTTPAGAQPVTLMETPDPANDQARPFQLMSWYLT